jgi:hypothetical protein
VVSRLTTVSTIVTTMASGRRAGRWLHAATVFARPESRSGFDRRTSDIYAHDEIGHVREAGLAEPGAELID